MMIVGTVCAAANGAALPVMIIVFGEMINLFTDTGKLTEFLDSIPEFLNVSNLTTDRVTKDPSLITYVLWHVCLSSNQNFSLYKIFTYLSISSSFVKEVDHAKL